LIDDILFSLLPTNYLTTNTTIIYTTEEEKIIIKREIDIRVGTTGYEKSNGSE